jgi:predicted nucleotidyltransferase
MHPYLNAHREEISALCRRYDVRRLEVFGSATDPQRFDVTRSDVDFLVEFEEIEGHSTHLAPTLPQVGNWTEHLSYHSGSDEQEALRRHVGMGGSLGFIE